MLKNESKTDLITDEHCLLAPGCFCEFTLVLVGVFKHRYMLTSKLLSVFGQPHIHLHFKTWAEYVPPA